MYYDTKYNENPQQFHRLTKKISFQKLFVVRNRDNFDVYYSLNIYKEFGFLPKWRFQRPTLIVDDHRQCL